MALTEPGAPADAPSVAPAVGPSPRQRRRWIASGVAALLVIGLVAALFLVRLPYYLVQPGSVRPAETRIEIEGAESFTDAGEVLFTTVFIDQATPALLLRSWLDDAVEVRTREEMYPEDNRDEVQQQNRARMDLSKLTATKVALDHLGIDADYAADGARVLGLVEDGPAEGVLHLDDVIVEVDGGEVVMPSDISVELEDRAPGDQVEVVVRRGPTGDASDADAATTLELTLGAADDDAGRPVLGIQVEPDAPRIESPVQVQVDSGTVSGPSAGLAWTLAIIDRLTPGSLTDGRRIAVTGEILPDGSVGAVGGVRQKVAAVKRAGLDLFIYPAATSEEDQAAMRRIAGDDVELRPVSDVSEAVAVLAPDGLEHPG
ncbi:MAG: YlbL family protein [Microthrixaceae bacterium]